MQHKTQSIIRIALTSATVLALSISCQRPAQLHRFNDCQELEDFLQDQILLAQNQPQVSTGGFFGCTAESVSMAPNAAEERGSDQSTADSSVYGSADREYSTTNTQELNVDEADFVKNDGDHIFVLRRGHLTILDAWPANQTHIVADLDLSADRVNGESNDQPFTMFFHQNRLMVVSNNWGRVNEGDMSVPWSEATVLSLYDVQDRSTTPTLLRRVRIDGRYLEARRVNDQVIIITASNLNWPQLSSSPFSEDANRAALENFGIAGMLPWMRDEVQGQGEAVERVATQCENTFAPDSTDGRSLVLVHSLSLSDPSQEIRSTTVVSPWSQVYGSEKSLYLASTEWSDGGYFTPNFASTRLHKFSLSADARSVEYQATGLIEGQIHNQFSMDEEGEDFRVVVSTDIEGQNSSLLVLSQEGDLLSEVGRADDIGKGEFVQSVRFFSDRAFVVTYPEQSFTAWRDPSIPEIRDPLFAIDLSEPHKPVLRGELEVTGYSTYIHPIDRDHVLTIGVDTDTSNVIQGLSLSIFDVTDLGSPQLAHRENFGDSLTWSEALTDHHAFTYFPAAKALGIPVQLSNSNGEQLQLQSTGLEVFQVDIDTGFTHLGRVEQAPMFSATSLDPWNVSCIDVRRSVMIADDTGAYVYAVSTGGVSVAEITQGLPAVASVPFLGADDPACPDGFLPL